MTESNLICHHFNLRAVEKTKPVKRLNQYPFGYSDFVWVNIIFSHNPEDENDVNFKSYCKDYRKVRVCLDPEKDKKYIESLYWEETKQQDGKKLDLLELKANTAYNIKSDSENPNFWAYEKVFNPLLTHLEKFNKFQFYQVLTLSPSTQGILRELEDLLIYRVNRSHTTDSYLLLRLLQAANIFWD